MTERDANGAGVTSIERDMGRSLADRIVAPYFRESALWPVTIVLLAHGALGVGVALLDAVRDGMGFGLVVLVMVGAGTATAFAHDLRRRSIGLTSGSLTTCWVLGALCAWAADHYGFY